jgi:hypothetical protein
MSSQDDSMVIEGSRRDIARCWNLDAEETIERIYGSIWVMADEFSGLTFPPIGPRGGDERVDMLSAFPSRVAPDRRSIRIA